nr:MAG TPA: tcix Putative treble-clef, zinc-finger, Zn-binding [Caudoviricetes sp.]
MKRRQCSKCDYYSRTENAWSTSATCDYILIEEHSR